jgi:hypothetical protein
MVVEGVGYFLHFVENGFVRTQIQIGIPTNKMSSTLSPIDKKMLETIRLEYVQRLDADRYSKSVPLARWYDQNQLAIIDATIARFEALESKKPVEAPLPPAEKETTIPFVYVVHEAHQTWRAVLPKVYTSKESAIAAAFAKWSARFEGSVVTVPGPAREIIWQHCVAAGTKEGKTTTTIRPDKETAFQIHQLEVSE